MQVIGLTGFAGSGKSTVANYLVEEHGFTRLSFAAPLKKMLRTLNPIMGTVEVEHAETPWNGGDWTPAHTTIHAATLDQVFGMYDGELAVKASPYGDEYRRLLQVLGTDCIRAVDQDFWVKAAVAQMTDDNGKYVFDDVRFPNEAEVIKDLNRFGLWNIRRPGFVAVNGHASEKWAGNMSESCSIENCRTQESLLSDVDVRLWWMTGKLEAVASVSI